MSSKPLPPFTAIDYLRDRRNWPWLLLAAYLSLCNLLVVPLDHEFEFPVGRRLMFWPLGAMLAEFALLPTWIVLSARPLKQRLVLGVCATLWLFLWWLFGLALYDDLTVRYTVGVLSLIPVLCTASATPFAIVRYLFAWRIVGREDGEVAAMAGIRQFLVFTTIVAGSLALVRLSAYSQGNDMSETWMQVGWGSGTAAATSSLLVLPMAWATLGVRRVFAGAALVAMLTVVATAAVLLWAADTPGGNLRIVIEFAIYLVPISFCTTGAVAFWIARASGYRLVIGKRESLQSSTDSDDA